MKDQSPAGVDCEPELSETELADILLSTFPVGTELYEAPMIRSGDRRYLVRAGVRTPEGRIEYRYIKVGDQIEPIQREAGVLMALAEVGLPAPAVLAGPLSLTTEAAVSTVLVMSELPGHPLPWCGTTSLEEADRTCRLLIHGVLRLHQLTEAVQRHSIASALPRVTLASELEEVRQCGGEWWETDQFARAADVLDDTLADAEAPLVFSNGDYNPLNFLHDGETVTGWVDFEHARFEDPHIGFVKFLLWSLDTFGWGTGVKAGLVERYLYAQNVSRREFAVRLVLRCLRHLQREVSVSGEEDSLQRRHMSGLLEDGLTVLEAGTA